MDNTQYHTLEDSINIFDVLKIARRRIKVLIIAFCCIYILSCLALFMIFRMKNAFETMYMAETAIMIAGETFEVKTPGGDIVQKTKDTRSATAFLESDIIARKAIEILKEKKGYDEPVYDMIEDMRRNMSLKADPKRRLTREDAEIIEISYKNPDPERAFATVAAIIEGYEQVQDEEAEEFYKSTYLGFKTQFDTLHNDLNEAKRKLMDFIMQHQDIMSIRHISRLSGMKSEDISYENITNYYLNSKAEIAEKDNFLNAIKELSKNDKLLAITNLHAMRKELSVDIELRKMLLDKKEELNVLLLVNEDAHPDVVRVRRELQSIHNKIDAEIQNAINQLELDIGVQKQQAEELHQMLTKPDMREIINKYGSLKKEVEVKQEAYENLKKDMQSLDMSEKIMRHSEITTLKEPVIPYIPSNTPKKATVKLVIIAFVLSVFGSVSIMYVFELMDENVKSIEDIENLSNVPVLATIPFYMKTKQSTYRQENKT
jgi:capsular polysaccharide biosynthesis protein